MKIKIVGEAGQGAKTLSIILGKILAQLEKHVSVSINYGTNVRSGIVTTDVVYSEERIDNPKILLPDVALVLANGPLFEECTHVISYKDFKFDIISFKRFGRTRFANMIALGKLLKHLEISLEDIDWEDKLPKKYYEENMESVKMGYAL